MADPGVVALDPVRLAGLGSYLEGLATGCARGAGDVEDHLAGTAESMPGEVAELRRLGEWCRVQAGGVRRCREAVEALPATLPLPAWAPGPAALARTRAEDLAPRLEDALADEPPDWTSLRPVLARVRRGLDDPAFVARLAELVGPEALVLLPIDLERSAGAAGSAAVAEDVAAARATVGALVTRVERPAGATGPSARWWDALGGLGTEPDDEVVARAEQGADDAGLATDVLSGLVGAWRVGRTGTSAGVSPLALAGLAADVADAVAEPDAVHVLSAIATGLRAVAALAGPAALPLYGGGIVLTLVAWAEAHDQDDDERDVRRDDTGTGERRYPSGSATNPDVDAAGLPLAGYA